MRELSCRRPPGRHAGRRSLVQPLRPVRPVRRVRRMRPPQGQRGALSLLAVLILLLTLAATLTASHQVLTQQHRATARATRADLAAQQADNGLAWALARLHDPRPVDQHCEPDAHGRPWRERALLGSPDLADAPRPGWRARCEQHEDGALECRCGNPLDAVASDLPGFDAQFGVDGQDPSLLVLQSIGCAGGRCDGREAGAAEGRARRQVVLRSQPVLRQWLEVPLAAGGDASLGAGLSLRHDAPEGGGVLVAAGGSIAGAAQADLASRVGTPGRVALAPADPALAAWAADLEPLRWSRALLGAPPDRLAHWPQAHALAADASAADRGAALARAATAGWRVFVSPGAIELPTGTYGRADDPVMLVSAGPPSCSGACTWVGMIAVAGDATSGTGGELRVQGAVSVRGRFAHAGVLQVQYDEAVLKTTRWRTRALWPVPGRWSDQ